MQISLFTGPELRDAGIKRSVDNANAKVPNWSEVAYEFLKKYITKNKSFLCEEVREASKGEVPEPPSSRAWGGVMMRAAYNGLIRKTGVRNVVNPKAHATPAAVWTRDY